MGINGFYSIVDWVNKKLPWGTVVCQLLGEDQEVEGAVATIVAWNSPALDLLDLLEKDMVDSGEEDEQEVVGQYVILTELSRGSFGRVVYCHSTEDVLHGRQGRSFALKICSTAKLRKIKYSSIDEAGVVVYSNALQKFEQECSILATLQHPNIVEYVEDFVDEEEGQVVLVMQLVAHGPVLHIFPATQRYAYNASLHPTDSDGWVPGHRVLGLFTDAVEAVAHLHAHHIAHRDLKPANLLLTAAGRLQLCDFGCAQRFDPAEAEAGLVSDTVGTPANWAPEAVIPEKYASEVGLDLTAMPEISSAERKTARRPGYRYSAYGLDAWALGVLGFAMLYLRHPFCEEGLSELELYSRIGEHDPFSDSKGAGERAGEGEQTEAAVVVGMREAVRGLLVKEPLLRWSVGDVQRHLLGEGPHAHK